MKFSILALSAIVSFGLICVPSTDAHKEKERAIPLGASQLIRGLKL